MTPAPKIFRRILGYINCLHNKNEFGHFVIIKRMWHRSVIFLLVVSFCESTSVSCNLVSFTYKTNLVSSRGKMYSYILLSNGNLYYQKWLRETTFPWYKIFYSKNCTHQYKLKAARWFRFLMPLCLQIVELLLIVVEFLSDVDGSSEHPK